MLTRLDATLEGRKNVGAAKSYTRSLYEGGPAKIGAKLREEADELAADAIEEEVERRQRQHAVQAGDPEDDPGKFHGDLRSG